MDYPGSGTERMSFLDTVLQRIGAGSTHSSALGALHFPIISH